MKRIVLLILLTLLVAGCNPPQPSLEARVAPTPHGELEKEEEREYPLPSFILTDLVNIKSSDAWLISGVIQQAEPVMAGLQFGEIMITFMYLDGRQCEWALADHAPLGNLTEPTPFTLKLNAGNYRHGGFGFTDFQDFKAIARLGMIDVRVLNKKYYLEYSPNAWTGSYEIVNFFPTQQPEDNPLGR